MAQTNKQTQGSEEDFGKTYEIKVIAYLILSLYKEEFHVKNFEICTNWEKFGNFDDIHLIIQKENGQFLRYLLQLKHFSGNEKDEPIKFNSFTSKGKKSFNLKESWESIKDLNVIPNTTTKYIYFTNKPNNNDKSKFLNYANDDDIKMIQMGGETISIKVDEITQATDEQGFKKFVKDFVIICGQPLEKDTDNKTTQLIEEILQIDNGSEVYLKYWTHLRNWKNKHCGNCEIKYAAPRVLTKEEIDFKLSELKAGSYLPRFDVSALPTIPEKQQQKWNEITAEHKAVFIDLLKSKTETASKETLSFVYGGIITQLSPYIDMSAMTKWNCSVPMEELKKFYGKIPDAKKEMTELWGDSHANKSTTYQQVFFYLWKKCKVPMVLHLNDTQLVIGKFSSLFTIARGRFIILMDNPIHENTLEQFRTNAHFNILHSFVDLCDTHQKWILIQNMFLQGRPTTVKKVFNAEQLKRNVFSMHIIQIIQNLFKIGEMIYNLPDIFISRNLKSVVVERTLFSNEDKYSYILFGETRETLEESLQQLNPTKKPFHFLAQCNDNPFLLHYYYYLNVDYTIDEINEFIESANSQIKYIFLRLNDKGQYQIYPDIPNIVREIYVIYCESMQMLHNYFENNYVTILPDELIDFSEKCVGNIPLTCKYIFSSEEIDGYSLKDAQTYFSFSFLELHYSDNIFTMEFLGSFTKSNKICEYIDHKSQFEGKFDIQNCFKYNLLNIITGCPGMGKSVLINYLIKVECPLRYFALLITFRQYYEYFQNINRNAFKINDILKHFLSENLQVPEDHFLEEFINGKKIVLFFDGFDEILPDVEDTVIEILKRFSDEGFCLFVTTRTVKVDELGSNLNSISRSIISFSKEDQTDYLQRYFTTKIQVEEQKKFVNEFVETLLKRDTQTSVWDLEFSSIPLQTHMIAGIYVEDCQKFCNREPNYTFENVTTDVLSLYQKFVDLKTQVLKEKLGPSRHFNVIVEDSLKKHQYLAIKFIFSEDVPNEIRDMEKIYAEFKNLDSTTGLIDKIAENKTPLFVHRTFAEYLAALFVSENRHQDYVKDLFTEILKNSVYDIIRQLIDRLLSKTCAIHRAFLNNEVTFTNFLNEEGELRKVDDAGRNILHIAMSWGRRHKLLSMAKIEKKLENIWSTVFLKRKLNDICNECKGNKGSESFVELILMTDERILLQPVDGILSLPPVNYGFKIMALDNIELYLKSVYEQTQNFDSITTIFDEFRNSENIVSDTSVQELLFICSLFDYKCLALAIFKSIPNFIHVGNSTFTNMEMSLLHFAAIQKSDGVILYLIENVITDVNLIDKRWRKTALHWAAELGHLSTVQLLINDANISLKDKYGNTALTVACNEGHLQIVDVLLRAGWVVDDVDEDKNTPLIKATNCGHSHIVQKLIQYKADINKCNKHDQTALIKASAEGNFEIVKLLVENKADLNLFDYDGNTALTWAIKKRHQNIAELLINCGVKIDKINSKNESALIIATKEGYLTIVPMLIQKGADIDASDWLDNSALTYAAQLGYFDILNILICNQANINYINRDEETALMEASKRGHFNCASFLLEKGADVNLVSKNVYYKGYTALCYASYKGYIDIVKTLSDETKKIKEPARYFGTALIAASNRGRFEIVKYLIEKEADLNLALFEACREGHLNVVQLLIHKGADITLTDRDKKTPLMYASMGGNVLIVQFLLNEGADATLVDCNGKSALDFALHFKRSTIVQVLREVNANVMV